MIVELFGAVSDQAQFDPGHLLSAIRNGFDPRLLALADAEPRPPMLTNTAVR